MDTKMIRAALAAICAAAALPTLAGTALSASGANEARKVLNIVNFVRSADPRPPRAFKAAHKANCPQTQIALEDWSGFGRKSTWYNSRFYRANLIMDGKRLVFRDIHKMCDDFEEPFLDKVCTGWQALYYTPPVVDQWMFRGKGVSGVMSFGGEFASIETATDGDALVVTAKRADGTAATVRFEEGRIVVSGAGTLDAEYADGDFRKGISIADGGVNFVFQGFRYRIPVRGSKVTPTAKGFHIDGDRIELDLSYDIR